MSEIGYHPNYFKYVEMIVAHPNYRGLYYDRDKNGKVNWVVTGKSHKGQLRQKWWDATCRRLGIPIQKGCYAKAARMIHPTGKHVCQCCGKERSIFYEYPTLSTLKRLNKAFGLNLLQTDYTILSFVEHFCTTTTQLHEVARLFKLPEVANKTELLKLLKDELIDKQSRYLSPGVMCNPPDRFNGFHSYALCCRKEKDTGRHDDNMKTYIQDRRAYEDWSDGNYNLANRMMGEFHKQSPIPCPICGKIDAMTADHIGPISLGFCHSIHFTPMCRSCNSAKNNRFTKCDVDKLKILENQGHTVVSWHSKFIWDSLKNKIFNDIDAKKASSLMAKCHQNVLYILALIYRKTGRAFLMRYLHPEYSMMDYRFKNFDLQNMGDIQIIESPLDSKNKRKNQDRYIRIAFESLEAFYSKENRKNYFLIKEEAKELRPIYTAINNNDFDLADTRLRALIELLSKRLVNLEWENNTQAYKIQEDETQLKVAEPNESI